MREWIIGMGRAKKRMDRYEKSMGENGLVRRAKDRIDYRYEKSKRENGL